ncbi:MAG: hypothetical protein ACI9VR_001805, partial [Cognaticolwellia sp.]
KDSALFYVPADQRGELIFSLIVEICFTQACRSLCDKTMSVSRSQWKW